MSLLSIGAGSSPMFSAGLNLPLAQDKMHQVNHCGLLGIGVRTVEKQEQSTQFLVLPSSGSQGSHRA